MGRLSGSWLLERLGRTRVLVLGGLAACAGMLVASLAPDVWLALAGFAVTGLGLETIVLFAAVIIGGRGNHLGAVLGAVIVPVGFRSPRG